MSDPSERFKKTDEHPESNAANPLALRRAFNERRGVAGFTAFEGVRLVCAVSAAVVLGVVCGLGLISLLAPAASTTPLASAQPAARADTRGAGVPLVTPEHRTDERGAAPSETVEVARPEARTVGETSSKSRPTNRADAVAAVEEEVGPPAKSAAPGAQAKADARESGKGGPCALYTSVDALTIRGGGAATLVAGGAGRAGAVTVTTPDWSDIAVFAEGRAGGGRGWVKYSVRSVSGRAGRYAVRVRTPCGSETIPVTVTRP